MPLFFFHLSSQGNISLDETGTEFPSLEAAYLETCDAILEIATERLRERQDPANDTFEIADEQRNVLMEVPFSEVLRPAAATNIASVRLHTIRILDSYREQVARSERLESDIREEFRRAKATFHEIRASLAQIAPTSSQ